MRLEFCDRCGKQISTKKMKYHSSIYADNKDVTPKSYAVFHENGTEIDLCDHCQELLDKTVANFLESGSKPKKVMGDPEM